MRSWLSLLVSLLTGAAFGAGLLLSGMHNPAKVRGFLDIFGPWQPGLIGVMGSAIPVFALFYWYSRRQRQPALADAFHAPPGLGIDKRLVIGAGLFGIGWGMVGLCPGPALVNLFSMRWEILLFLCSLLAGNRLAALLVGPASAR